MALVVSSAFVTAVNWVVSKRYHIVYIVFLSVSILSEV